MGKRNDSRLREARPLSAAQSGLAVVLLAAGMLAGLATGCEESPAAAPQSADAVTFTDDAGRTITLASEAERVVAAASFAVELLMALDHPPVLRPDVPDRKIHPETAHSIPTLTVHHQAGLDVEAIAAAGADLVICHVDFAPFAEDIARTLGVPVALLEVRSLEDVSAKLELLGRITGREDEAARQVAALRTRIADVLKRDRPTPPRVLALFGTAEAFYAYRERSYLGSMIEALGAENVAAGGAALRRANSLTPLDLEQAIGRDAEVILVVPHGPRQAVLGYLMSHPAWSRMQAVRAGRVHVLDEVLFSANPGPRAAEALERLERLLYSETP